MQNKQLAGPASIDLVALLTRADRCRQTFSEVLAESLRLRDANRALRQRCIEVRQPQSSPPAPDRAGMTALAESETILSRKLLRRVVAASVPGKSTR